MSFEKKTDYVSGGLDKLRQAYKERPNIAALLSAYLAHAQTLEDSLFDLREGLLLANATGATLDGYASVLGIDRNGLDDDSMRLLVLAAIAASHGDATTNTLVLLAKKLFQTDSVFIKTPLAVRRDGGPTGAFITLAIGSPKLPSRLWPLAEKLLAQNVGAGIQCNALYTFDADGCVAFASRSPGAKAPWVGTLGSVNDNSVGSPLGSLLDRTV